eukprot:3230724-Prymnesium_polylepis.1
MALCIEKSLAIRDGAMRPAVAHARWAVTHARWAVARDPRWRSPYVSQTLFRPASTAGPLLQNR